MLHVAVRPPGGVVALGILLERANIQRVPQVHKAVAAADGSLRFGGCGKLNEAVPLWPTQQAAAHPETRLQPQGHLLTKVWTCRASVKNYRPNTHLRSSLRITLHFAGQNGAELREQGPQVRRGDRRMKLLDKDVANTRRSQEWVSLHPPNATRASFDGLIRQHLQRSCRWWGFTQTTNTRSMREGAANQVTRRRAFVRGALAVYTNKTHTCDRTNRLHGCGS